MIRLLTSRMKTTQGHRTLEEKHILCKQWRQAELYGKNYYRIWELLSLIYIAAMYFCYTSIVLHITSLTCVGPRIFICMYKGELYTSQLLPAHSFLLLFLKNSKMFYPQDKWLLPHFSLIYQRRLIDVAYILYAEDLSCRDL